MTARLLAGLLHRQADVLRHRPAGAVVAALLDPAAELCHVRTSGVVGDVGRLSDRIRLDCQHARPGAKCFLNHRVLAAPVDAPCVEDDGRLAVHAFLVLRVARHCYLLNE